MKYNIKVEEGLWYNTYSTYNLNAFLVFLYNKTKIGKPPSSKPWVLDYTTNRQLDFYYDRGHQMLKIHLKPRKRCYDISDDMFMELFYDLASMDGKTVFTKKGKPIRIAVDTHGFPPWKHWPWLKKEIPPPKPKGFWHWFWNGET